MYKIHKKVLTISNMYDMIKLQSEIKEKGVFQMAVYKADMESLARFISDTKLGFTIHDVNNTEKWYTNDGFGNVISLSVRQISCKNICVTNDCFISSDGSIVVAISIPEIEYNVWLNEYNDKECKIPKSKTFRIETNSMVLDYDEIENDAKIETYYDFKVWLDRIIDYIGHILSEEIRDYIENKFKTEIGFDVIWQVDRIKNQ